MAKSITIANNLLFSSVESCIREGKSVRVQVKGTSMRPYLRSGRDSVEFAPFVPEELKVGDVVLFRYRDSFVMHRIRHIDGENLVIQGDGVLFSREEVKLDAVVAIVRTIFRCSPKGEKAISTSSKCWERKSRFWLRLPLLVKRVILHFL